MPPIADTQTGAVARIACRGTEGSLAGFPPLHRAARSIGTGFRSHAITAASSQVVQCISTSDASLLLGNGSLSLLLRCLAPPRPFKGGGVGVTLLLHQLSDLAQLGVHLLLLAVGLLGFLPLRTCATRQGLRCCGAGAPPPGARPAPGSFPSPSQPSRSAGQRSAATSHLRLSPGPGLLPGQIHVVLCLALKIRPGLDPVLHAGGSGTCRHVCVCVCAFAGVVGRGEERRGEPWGRPQRARRMRWAPRSAVMSLRDFPSPGQRPGRAMPSFPSPARTSLSFAASPSSSSLSPIASAPS